MLNIFVPKVVVWKSYLFRGNGIRFVMISKVIIAELSSFLKIDTISKVKNTSLLHKVYVAVTLH